MGALQGVGDSVKIRFFGVGLLAIAAVSFGCTRAVEKPPAVDAWQLVQCNSDDDCPSGACLDSGVCGLACATNAGCPDFAPWSCGDVDSERRCVCEPTGEDVCTGADEDCNGVVDDGDNLCPAGAACEAGKCVCDEELICDGECVDKQTDDLHCGECGNACEAGNICVDGGCTPFNREWASWSKSGERFESVKVEGSAADKALSDALDLDTQLIWETQGPAATGNRMGWTEANSRCDSFRGQAPLKDKPEPGERRWRLPTRIELLSIVDYSKSDPVLNDVFEGGARNSVQFWSSSESASDDSEAWYVSFKDGRSGTFSKVKGQFRGRCVK